MSLTPVQRKPDLNAPWEMHTDYWLHSPYYRQTVGEHLSKKTHVGPDGFQVCLYVHNFAPNEISVKAIDKNIIVEAKHEDRPDEHGDVSRHFRRTYRLPEGFDPSDIVTTISSDGILTIKAPPVAPASKNVNVRHIQIQHTGPAHLNVKDKIENIDSMDGEQ